MRFARVSRRYQEMVYDEARWIKRLISMGCWDEAEARRKSEGSSRRMLGAQVSRQRHALPYQLQSQPSVSRLASRPGLEGNPQSIPLDVRLQESGGEEKLGNYISIGSPKFHANGGIYIDHLDLELERAGRSVNLKASFAGPAHSF